MLVAHVILVSAQGPNPSFFFFWGTFIRLGGLLGPGFGPGLDNKSKKKIVQNSFTTFESPSNSKRFPTISTISSISIDPEPSLSYLET